MRVMDFYLLLGIVVHIAFLGLADWLGYRHLVQHGYDHTVLILGILNIAIFIGLYYIVYRPLRERAQLRKSTRTANRQPLQQEGGNR